MKQKEISRLSGLLYLLTLIWKEQFFRFICVGSFNTVIGYLLFAAFLFFGLNYNLACLFATLTGALISFKTNGRYVFYHDKNSLIFGFITVYVLLYFINILLLYLGSRIIPNMYLNGLICTVPVAAMAYLLNRYYVFRLIHDG